VEENALLVSGLARRIPGLTLVEHEFTVPVDHEEPGGETLTVFAREVIVDAPNARDLPLLVFFQGGPGHEAPRPLAEPPARSWLHRALRDYRVLLLDRRGTGRSSPWVRSPASTRRPRRSS
jgi:pimeloyl-ACP methyl ester carboxylesterase